MKVDSQISILMKGSPGFGKTLAAATFAIEGPIYLAYWDKKKPIELDNFFRSVLKRPDLLKNIEYDSYSSHNANEFLNKLISFTKNFRYFAFICDSVTSMTASTVNWSLGFRPNKGKDRDVDRILPSWDEYKSETSIVSQSLDICKSLPGYTIWTAHPVSRVKIEGSGSSQKVTKINPIVSYGSKVGDLVPGEFTEIYQFSKSSQWDGTAGKSKTRYIVDTEAVGDDYAKSALGLTESMDITGIPFYEVWKEELKKLKERNNDLAVTQATPTVINPFAQTTPIPLTQNVERETNKKWNAEKGAYE